MTTPNERTLLDLMAHRLQETARQLVTDCAKEGDIIEHVEISGTTVVGTGQRLVSTDPFKTEPFKRTKTIEVPITLERTPEAIQ